MHAFVSLTFVVLLWMASLVSPSSVAWGESYLATATAIADACEDRPVFGSELRCAAVLVALGYHESRFDPSAVGDKGQSVGVWQLSRVWLDAGDDTAAQARTVVTLVERSRRICGGPLEDALGWYASGGATCGRRATSRIRMRLAGALLRP